MIVPTQNPPRDREFDYLGVDQFMQTLVQARALATALELRLLDLLGAGQVCTFDSLRTHTQIEGPGLRLLLELLKANNVIEENHGEINFTREFQEASRFRDLLEAKLEFANLAAADLLDSFSLLISNPPEFMRRAKMFQLFNYGNCLEASPENYEKARRWIRFTTVLTKYEALVLMKYHDFSPYRRLLDLGGNSGEFARQLCRRHPQLQATVFDLPLVCEIGQQHILTEPEAPRISFLKGNALTDGLPTGFDLIVFKSVLHDWPEKTARRLLNKASGSLKPGGTLLIFERGPLEASTLPYSILPFLLFAHSFRPPAIYVRELEALGFREITVRRIDLEMPFHLITAQKPN